MPSVIVPASARARFIVEPCATDGTVRAFWKFAALGPVMADVFPALAFRRAQIAVDGSCGAHRKLYLSDGAVFAGRTAPLPKRNPPMSPVVESCFVAHGCERSTSHHHVATVKQLDC